MSIESCAPPFDSSWTTKREVWRLRPLGVGLLDSDMVAADEADEAAEL